MTKDQYATTTRRDFLGGATVTAAALAAPEIGKAEETSGGRATLTGEFNVAQASTDTAPENVAGAMEEDWSKPAAMAIPKEGYFKLEQGRHGPIFPRTPANYGFTIIAKVKPGREQAVRDYS